VKSFFRNLLEVSIPSWFINTASATLDGKMKFSDLSGTKRDLVLTFSYFTLTLCFEIMLGMIPSVSESLYVLFSGFSL